MEAVARGVLNAALERESLEAPVELELDRIQALGPLGELPYTPLSGYLGYIIAS